MSSRKKPTELPQRPQGMTVIPSIYVDQYEYTLENGMLGCRFGRRGHTHADITLLPSLILDLAEKLKATMNQPTEETKP